MSTSQTKHDMCKAKRIPYFADLIMYWVCKTSKIL